MTNNKYDILISGGNIMKLKNLRKRNGYSQKYIANHIGITDKTYANYENGITEPNIKTIIDLADFFHITTDELLERKNSNIIDKGLLRDEEINIIDIMKQLNDTWLSKLEGYAVAFLTTQNEQNEIIQKIKGEK